MSLKEKYIEWKRKRKLEKLAKKIIPHGTCHWTVPNQVTFQITSDGPRGVSIWASVEDKTGHLTYLWNNHDGFGTDNETLRNWVKEGMELLETEYKRREENEIALAQETEAALLASYETRFKKEPISAMD